MRPYYADDAKNGLILNIKCKIETTVYLTGAFIICLIVTYFMGSRIDYFLSGRIALSIMLLFTSIGHFVFTKGMTMMVPDFIPFPRQIRGLMEVPSFDEPIKTTKFRSSGYSIIGLEADFYTKSEE